MIVALLLHLVIFSLLLYWYWTKQPAALKGYFWFSVSFKILAGVGLGIVYTQYYLTGDTLHYFADGKIVADLARADIRAYLQFLWDDSNSNILQNLTYGEPRALFFVKFVSLINLLTGDNYWITGAYFSLISFFGAWYLLRVIHLYLSAFTLPAFIAFHLMPSVVFWTSGLIKESLACAAAFYLTALFLNAWFNHRIRIANSLLAVVALWVLWGLKYYYAAIFISVTFTCFMYQFVFYYLVKPKKPVSELLLWIFIFIFPLAMISFMHPNFYLDGFLEVIVSNNEVYNTFSNPEDLIVYHALKPEVGSVLMNAPLALISGLFRPAFFESGNIFQAIAALENLLLVLLVLFALPALVNFTRSPYRILILAVTVYVCLLCVFIALSTPNFGTLSRYRAGYIPYFVFIILCDNPALNFIQRSWFRLVR